MQMIKKIWYIHGRFNSVDEITASNVNFENYLIITGFSLFQGKNTKKYKELGPANFSCKRVLLYLHLFITRFL